MRLIESYSVLWGSPNNPATRDYQQYATDAEAMKARNAAYMRLHREGRNVKRATLKNQLRPYWGFQQPCGRMCNVYEIYEGKAND